METSQDLVNAMKELFIVRDDCYPKQLKGVNEYTVVKEGFSDEIITRHIQGMITVGSFQIDPKTNKVKWICFDFDGDLEAELKKSKTLYQRLKERGYSPLLEFSGRRGYHIWLFVEPVDASVAKMFAQQAAEGIQVSEIFPKQDKISENEFGGQVKLPLGLHRVSYKRSYFFDDNFEKLPSKDSEMFLLDVFSKRKNMIKMKNMYDFI